MEIFDNNDAKTVPGMLLLPPIITTVTAVFHSDLWGVWCVWLSLSSLFHGPCRVLFCFLQVDRAGNCRSGEGLPRRGVGSHLAHLRHQPRVRDIRQLGVCVRRASFACLEINTERHTTQLANLSINYQVYNQSNSQLTYFLFS